MKNNGFCLYKTLHSDCFSIKKDNKIVEKSKIVCLFGFKKFNVSDTGQKRVKKTKIKRIHANISFKEYKAYSCLKELFKDQKINKFKLIEINYNPFKGNYFYKVENKEKVFFLNQRVFCFDKKVFILKEEDFLSKEEIFTQEL